MKSLFVAALLALLLIVPLLLFSSAALSNGEDLKLPAYQSITVPGGYFIPIEIQAGSNSSWIAYSMQSNVSISTALMNANQFNLFNTSLTDDISNAVTYHNGTSAQADLQVSLGTYYLVFYNNPNAPTANVSFTFIAYPYTPYVAGPIIPPDSSGLASFGLYNVSGSAVPYAIKTPTIIGSANVSSIQAYNASAPSVNDTVSGATLQLNAVLVAEGANNSQQVYWAQNTPDFVTNATQVSYNDNLWNNTDLAGYLSNQTVTSPNGPSVFPTGSNQTQSQYFYAYGTNNYTYALPFDFNLLLNESVTINRSVTIYVGVQVLQNGSAPSPAPVSWFDNITVSIPGVQKAYFYIDGNDSTPVGSYYDAELVYGGEGNLEATNFTSMSSTLGLYYVNGTSSQITPFPSFYSFGGDTGESADNLHVTYLGNGTARVGIGTPNYVYLGGESPVVNSTTTSSSVSGTSITSQVASSSSFASSTTSSTSSSSSAGAISSSYLVALVPAALVMLLAGALVVRRRTATIK